MIHQNKDQKMSLTWGLVYVRKAYTTDMATAVDSIKGGKISSSDTSSLLRLMPSSINDDISGS